MQARWGRHLCWTARVLVMHPRPPGRHIAIDSLLLILSFEMKFFVCRHVSIWGFKTVSVCLYPEERNHTDFINISLLLVIDTSMERSSRVLHHGNPKIWFFIKVWNWILTCSWRAEIIQVGLNMHTYMTTSGMHCHPFEGWHQVWMLSRECCPNHLFVLFKKVIFSLIFVFWPVVSKSNVQILSAITRDSW